MGPRKPIILRLEKVLGDPESLGVVWPAVVSVSRLGLATVFCPGEPRVAMNAQADITLLLTVVLP
jgi:hypothetical protein